MSGLAGLLKSLGYTVTGSDRDASHKTDALSESGIPVEIGHRAESVDGADIVVYTAAIPAENVERVRADALGIPQIERSVLLGQLMEGYGTAIGISGTHGKTTTTAMAAQVFVETGTNPTVHIGGELDALGGSTLLGARDIFIAEACEFAASFLQLNPTLAVILNIDEDHLDFYKDIDHIEAAFLDYARRTAEDGCVIGWGDDPRVLHVLSACGCDTRTFGLAAHNELRAENISYDEIGRPTFTATLFGHPLTDVTLGVAGEHNLLNALAVIALAEKCQLPMHRVAEILSAFVGAHRRFELTSVTDGAFVYQDYGHNPTEIKNALHIAKLRKRNRLWAVWQPHTYSRTKKLFDAFLDTFYDADAVLITDICAARESDPGDIHAGMLIEPLRARGVDAYLTPSFDDAERYLRAHWQPGDTVVTLGCGNIDLLNDQIKAHGDTTAAK
jgi:UDP-N-acetylmuramate--alanine ligase